MRYLGSLSLAALLFVAMTACRDTPANATAPLAVAIPNLVAVNPSLAGTEPYCGETSCVPLGGKYISHFTGLGCTGTESYYTLYFDSDGVSRSWDGQGIAGTTLRTVTNRSWEDSIGGCHNDWPSGNTLSGFVTIYRTYCGDAAGCVSLGGKYISHFTGAGCTGTENYYTLYFGSDGVRRSWDGRGIAGSTLYTQVERSYKDSTGTCHDAWPSGNPLSYVVNIYRCGDAAGCVSLGGKYISHFTGAGCTGTESYYTRYFNSDGIRRSWDGQGVAGKTLDSLTTRSYKDSTGTCYDAWINPPYHPLGALVRIYR